MFCTYTSTSYDLDVACLLFLAKHKDSFILCPCAVSRTFLIIHYLEQYPKSENKHSVTISKQFYCL